MVEESQGGNADEQLARQLQDQLNMEAAGEGGEGSQPDEAIRELQEHDIKVMSRLEDFCASGEFTQYLAEFTEENATKFNPQEEEQSIECYQLWQQFKTHIDQKLEEFIQGQAGELELTAEKIMQSLQRIQEVDDGMLTCIDYLLAAADYQDFVSLMLDFKSTQEWEGPEDDMLQLLAEDQAHREQEKKNE